MKHSLLSLASLPSLLTIFLLSGTLTMIPAADTQKHYLFSYFKNNGEDGMHLAHSRDGLTWQALNQDKALVAPQVGGRLMRDPFICRGGDGRFHMVWSSSWEEPGFGLAHSDDLIHWSSQQFVPAMKHEPQAWNCWAPEIVYDPDQNLYLLYWSTTIPGRFPETDSSGDKATSGTWNHRIYGMTTKDFSSYSGVQLLCDPGFNCIDANIVRDQGRWVMFLKNETRQPEPKKDIRIATSDKLTGPYTNTTPPITPSWVEGPCALKIGARWICYFDMYTKNRYGAVASTDMKRWEDISDQVHLPAGARHGCAFEVPAQVAKSLLAREPTAAAHE